MGILDFFKKRSRQDLETRRNFIRNSLGALIGAAALAKADNVFATRSKTGFIYVKRNGEIINNYSTRGDESHYIGQLICVGFNFNPPGWEMCNGQLFPISEYKGLFSLLGTAFGGDGITSMALPDLRGRGPIGVGQGTTLTNRMMGDSAGEEKHLLTKIEMPQHNHNINVNSAAGKSSSPSGDYISGNAEGISQYAASSDAVMNGISVANTGGGLSHNNMQPYLTLNWIIALDGVFPEFSPSQ